MSEDAWNIGTLNKSGIWVYYSLSNFVGVLLCSLLIWSVYKNPKTKASDVFVAGLASGCLTLSLTCGGQCFVNLIAERFHGGVVACQIEAIAHISSILTEFVCVMAISICAYLANVIKYELSIIAAVRIVIAIWFTCTIVTGLASLVSNTYLMSAGTYCFFEFRSFAIAGLLLPGLVISLAVMIYCHCKIFRHFTGLLHHHMNMDEQKEQKGQVVILSGGKKFICKSDIWLQQFKWRSTIFILALLFGWIFAAIASIYELAISQAPEWLVTCVGVGGVSFSFVMPIIYSMTSKHHKLTLIWFFGCFCIPFWGMDWFRSRQKTTPGVHKSPDHSSIKF